MKSFLFRFDGNDVVVKARSFNKVMYKLKSTYPNSYNKFEFIKAI